MPVWLRNIIFVVGKVLKDNNKELVAISKCRNPIGGSFMLTLLIIRREKKAFNIMFAEDED